MSKDRHTGFMALHSHPIVLRVAQKKRIPEREALRLFYRSELYKVYEREETKLWHFSRNALGDMLIHEIETGKPQYL
jgi:hypothetical protein